MTPGSSVGFEPENVLAGYGQDWAAACPDLGALRYGGKRLAFDCNNRPEFF
jgi:hypothetical protein